ncbi:MAG: hypothetical protein QOG48_2010 [Verrucomicrobiota bacterium]
MKRALIFIVIAALIVGAGAYVWRTRTRSTSTAVTSLLPRDTVAFAHLPDLNRTRSEWKRSDIYQLYREPAVQEFLRGPLANHETETDSDLEKLGVENAFVALTSLTNNAPHLVGGFRFHGSQELAQRVVNRWLPNASGRESLDYEQHKIDIVHVGSLSIAQVFDREWFFAANDVADLKALLDRADNRAQDRQSTLAADENFRGAMAELPGSYALAFYLQPKPIAQQFPALRDTQVNSICGASRFENGKIHDTIFVATPRSTSDAKLTRESLSLGTPDTFLYVASVLNFSTQLALVDQTSGVGIFGGALQKISGALAAAHISAADWQAAFGSEVGVIGDWPANAHWPAGVAVFPVKDFARAKQLATALAHAADHDANWIESDRNGAHYIAMQSAPGFLILRPTIAITNRVMFAGVDVASVDAAVQRNANPSSGLANSAAYKSAASSLPAPTNSFAYVDLALLYSRLDAAMRPMLMFGAAFMPSANNYVDLARIPPVEVVTKHLSPMTTSQRETNGGYVIDSIGPLTLNHTGIALAILGGFGREMSGFALPTASPTPRRRP